MNNEILDNREFYEILNHVLWAAQGKDCKYNHCRVVNPITPECQGCNLLCENSDKSYSCMGVLLKDYLAKNLRREEEEDEY